MVAIVLAAASARRAVLSSLAGGWLADRISARRLLVVLSAADGIGLICYVFAHDFVSALVIAVLVGAIEQAANSTRMAIIARAFEGDQRVHARADCCAPSRTSRSPSAPASARSPCSRHRRRLPMDHRRRRRHVPRGRHPARETARARRRTRDGSRARPPRPVTTATGSTDCARHPLALPDAPSRAHSPWP
jgi:hypothetical protein